MSDTYNNNHDDDDDQYNEDDQFNEPVQQSQSTLFMPSVAGPIPASISFHHTPSFKHSKSNLSHHLHHSSSRIHSQHHTQHSTNGTTNNDNNNTNECIDNDSEPPKPLSVNTLHISFLPFFILILGFFLLFASYSLVQNLAYSLFGSSTASLTIGVVYIAFIFSSIVSPVLLTTVFKNDAMLMMFIGSISYTLLTIACIFANLPLLLVGGFLCGSSAGLIWIAYSSALVAFGRKISEDLFYAEYISNFEQQKLDDSNNNGNNDKESQIIEQQENFIQTLRYPNGRLNTTKLNKQQQVVIDVTTSAVLGLLNSIAWVFLNLDVVFGGLVTYFVLNGSGGGHGGSGGSDDTDPSKSDVNSRPLFIILAFASTIANILFFIARVKMPKTLFFIPPTIEEQDKQRELQVNSNSTDNNTITANQQSHSRQQQIQDESPTQRYRKFSQPQIHNYPDPNHNNNNNNTEFESSPYLSTDSTNETLNHSQQQQQQNDHSINQTSTDMNSTPTSPTSSEYGNTLQDSDVEMKKEQLLRKNDPFYVLSQSVYLMWQCASQQLFLLSLPIWFAQAIPICWVYSLWTANYMKPILGTANIALFMISVASIDCLTALSISKVIKTESTGRIITLCGAVLQLVLIFITMVVPDVATDSQNRAWIIALVVAFFTGLSDAAVQVSVNSVNGMIIDASGASQHVQSACFGLITVIKTFGSVFIFLSPKWLAFHLQQKSVFGIVVISIIFQVLTILFPKLIDAKSLEMKYEQFRLPWDNSNISPPSTSQCNDSLNDL